MEINLDPSQTHFSLSKKGEAALEQLGIALPREEKRRQLVDAARRGIKPMEELQEINFLATARINGQEVVLLCLATGSSPYSKKSQTVIVRGAYTLGQAAKLASIGNGLSPFVSEAIETYRNTNANDRSG